MVPDNTELPIIQRTYDLILWYVPRLNKLPRNYKYALGHVTWDRPARIHPQIAQIATDEGRLAFKLQFVFSQGNFS